MATKGNVVRVSSTRAAPAEDDLHVVIDQLLVGDADDNYDAADHMEALVERLVNSLPDEGRPTNFMEELDWILAGKRIDWWE